MWTHSNRCSHDDLLSVKWHWLLLLCANFQRSKGHCLTWRVTLWKLPPHWNFCLGAVWWVRKGSKHPERHLLEIFLHMMGHEFETGTWFWSSDVITDFPLQSVKIKLTNKTSLLGSNLILAHTKIHHCYQWIEQGSLTRPTSRPHACLKMIWVLSFS